MIGDAGLLPNGKQQFLDGNGQPLTAGSVTFYIPSTTTYKDTWQDAARSTVNTNPVMLDSSGEALIYGYGAYRQVVKDFSGAVIWDEVVFSAPGPFPSWGGTSTGSANSQTIGGLGWLGNDGEQIAFKAGVGLTNTGAAQITIGTSGPYGLVLDLAAGPTPLSGGEIVAGNTYTLTYDSVAGTLHLGGGTPPVVFSDGVFRIYKASNPSITLAFSLANYTSSHTITPTNISGVLMLDAAGTTALASAATTDLGSSVTEDIGITGTASISSFGSAAQGTFRRCFFTQSGATLVNSANLVLPSGANIVGAVNDAFGALAQGSGVWRVLYYSRISGNVVKGLGVGQTWQSVARSAGTVYTNSTGYPIQVSVRFHAVNNGEGGNLIIGGVTVAYYAAFSDRIFAALVGIVPVGATYEVTLDGSAVIDSWLELR